MYSWYRISYRRGIIKDNAAVWAANEEEACNRYLGFAQFIGDLRWEKKFISVKKINEHEAANHRRIR